MVYIYINNKHKRDMKTYIINIEKQSVSVNGESCNFIEAGLTDPDGTLTDREEIVEVMEEQNEGEEIRIIFEGGLADDLFNEIRSYEQVEPRAKMFVDASSIFWVTRNNHFVWMAEHSGINNYIDGSHPLVTEQTPEGVGSEGVWWNNGDFESPFHITDFLARIETVNV